MKGTCIQQETLRLWANLTPLFLMFFERLRFSRVLVSCHLRRLGTNVQKHVRRASAVFIPSPFSHRKYIFTFTKNVFEWLWPEVTLASITYSGQLTLENFTRIWEKFPWKEIEWASLEPKGMRHHESCLRVFSWGMQMCNTCCFITFTPGENLSRLGRLLSNLFCIWLGDLFASGD